MCSGKGEEEVLTWAEEEPRVEDRSSRLAEEWAEERMRQREEMRRPQQNLELPRAVAAAGSSGDCCCLRCCFHSPSADLAVDCCCCC